MRLSHRLYVIGVGPGDPELLTLKAVRIIKEVPVLFVPKGREDGKSIALSIVSRAVDISGKEIRELHFPMVKTRQGDVEQLMRWEIITGEIINALESSSCAFLTMGDPSFYSTFFYLYNRLLDSRPGLIVEIIPGVSSINAGAARAGVPLGLADERIAIIPANYFDPYQADPYFSTKLSGEVTVIDSFDTVVFMKIDRNFEDIRRFLLEKGLDKKAVYISRVGMEGEKVVRDIEALSQDDLDYFSLLIVRRR